MLRHELDFFDEAKAVGVCDFCGAEILRGYDCVYSKDYGDIFCNTDCALAYWGYEEMAADEIEGGIKK